MAENLPVLRAVHSLSPGRFLVLAYVRNWLNPRLEGLRKLKNTIGLVGIRISNLPDCIIMPQPTTLQRAPLSYIQSVGLLGLEFSPSKCLYPHTGQHKQRINGHKHPCLEWDSNLWFQCYRGRRQFIHKTTMPLWSAVRSYSNRKWVMAIINVMFTKPYAQMY
jgi:hypothetical protein